MCHPTIINISILILCNTTLFQGEVEGDGKGEDYVSRFSSLHCYSAVRECSGVVAILRLL